MLAMIDNARHSERADPRFWAPFVVVGEPASALIGERNGRVTIKNALDEPTFSWLLIFLRADLGELAHACGLIAFDGHLKLLRSDQGPRASSSGHRAGARVGDRSSDCDRSLLSGPFT
jgi:hypothetical protein